MDPRRGEKREPKAKAAATTVQKPMFQIVKL